MSQSIDLKQADRKVFTASFDDGLVDIFISSVTLMFAVGPLTTAYINPYLGDFWGDLLGTVMFLPLWGITYLVLRWIRKKFVGPRRGVIKFGPTRKRKMSTFSWLMLTLNVVFLILGILFAVVPSGPGWLNVLPFSAMVLISFTLAAYFLDLNRFYIYGLMLGLAPIVGEWLYREFGVSHHGFPVTFGIATVVIFLVGLVKLFSILRENPFPVEEPTPQA